MPLIRSGIEALGITLAPWIEFRERSIAATTFSVIFHFGVFFASHD
jgi:hypothetical protein